MTESMGRPPPEGDPTDRPEDAGSPAPPEPTGTRPPDVPAEGATGAPETADAGAGADAPVGSSGPSVSPEAAAPTEEVASTSFAISESWIYGVLVLGLFGALAVSVLPVLSPFVLYVVFLYVIWPRVSVPFYARLTAAASGLIVLWIVEVTGLLLAPFILAVILAYVLDPAVDRLQRHRIPRPAAIGLLTLPLLGFLALLIFVLIPAVANQLSQLIANVPTYVSGMEAWIRSLRAWVIGLGIEGLTEQTVPQLREIDAQAIVEYLRQRQTELAEQGFSAITGIGRGIGSILAVVGYLVLLPILTYYLLRDWDKIRGPLRSLVPQKYRGQVNDFATEYDRLLNRYLRGQLLLALCVGLMIGVFFWIAQFPYALLLGIIAGVLNIVPYLGLVVSILVATVIALFSSSMLTALLKVGVVFAVEQLIEGIIGPLIVGESVGLHPVWVILSLALFGFFLGFVGLLIAVPAAVFLKLMIVAGIQRYQSSSWFSRVEEGKT